jgi:hypothetical protein
LLILVIASLAISAPAVAFAECMGDSGGGGGGSYEWPEEPIGGGGGGGTSGGGGTGGTTSPTWYPSPTAVYSYADGTYNNDYWQLRNSGGTSTLRCDTAYISGSAGGPNLIAELRIATCKMDGTLVATSQSGSLNFIADHRLEFRSGASYSFILKSTNIVGYTYECKMSIQGPITITNGFSLTTSPSIIVSDKSVPVKFTSVNASGCVSGAVAGSSYQQTWLLTVYLPSITPSNLRIVG